MNDYNPGGGGCLSVPVLLLCCFLLFGMLVAGGGDDTSTNTANVEALSRNQLNVLSDVTNEYYNCLAAGSCVTSVTSTSTQTSTTNAPVTVEGDRNTVMTSPWGEAMCWDDSLQTYTTSACQEAQP